MAALPPKKADKQPTPRDVRFLPKATTAKEAANGGGLVDQLGLPSASLASWQAAGAAPRAITRAVSRAAGICAPWPPALQFQKSRPYQVDALGAALSAQPN